MLNKVASYFSCILACTSVGMPFVACRAQESIDSFAFVHIGEMHEAIGQGRHHGRIALAKIVDLPHFYGVGALAGLEGEITILDSTAIITGVARDGLPQPKEVSDARATILVGQSIGKWMETTLAQKVPHEQFDKSIRAMAAKHGIDVAKPFVFVLKGEFTDVRLHVINGACPIRARMKKEELGKDKRPFELEAKTLKGTIVGIFAQDSVGKLTHPATTTHAHLIYSNAKTGKRLTGHIEQVGLAKAAVLRLPANGEQTDEREPE